MSARNFDNIPPHATNTVTISTTPQVRVTPGSGQLRSIPIRPQPVPIRKIHHDGNPINSSSTSSTTTPSAITNSSNNQAGTSTPAPSFNSIHIKEEIVETSNPNIDYQNANSSGPLLPPSTSANSFQQYQRGSGPGTSTSANNGNSGSLSMDQPAPFF
ncbi:unnamed protein product [Caenorhabditis angaria]|uniref:Uncharacterized protein n=1 Tax=Caenorhabditis angaria TaxID=860376 RepID=A0A9P1IRL4_9PELO|nr:unnamed protein product [Caenorhabditis angaria]